MVQPTEDGHLNCDANFPGHPAILPEHPSLSSWLKKLLTPDDFSRWDVISPSPPLSLENVNPRLCTRLWSPLGIALVLSRIKYLRLEFDWKTESSGGLSRMFPGRETGFLFFINVRILRVVPLSPEDFFPPENRDLSCR